MASNKRDVCVIGIGKFGQAIVEQLIELQRYVLAIDLNETNLVKASRITTTAVADAADIEALRYLGLSKFKTVIVAASDNIEIIAALIELGVTHIIAKGKSVRHERVLKQIGVDVIIRPEAEAGVRTALIAANPNFIKYSEGLQEVGDGYVIGSTVVNDINWLGKELKDLPFSSYGASIVSIGRAKKVFLPSGGVILKSQDVLTIIGKLANITKIMGLLNDEAATQALKLSKMHEAAKAANLKRISVPKALAPIKKAPQKRTPAKVSSKKK